MTDPTTALVGCTNNKSYSIEKVALIKAYVNLDPQREELIIKSDVDLTCEHVLAVP